MLCVEETDTVCECLGVCGLAHGVRDSKTVKDGRGLSTRIVSNSSRRHRTIRGGKRNDVVGGVDLGNG